MLLGFIDTRGCNRYLFGKVFCFCEICHNYLLLVQRTALDSDSPGLSPSCHTWMAQASLSADLFFCHRAMSPHGAVYSAVSVDPTLPFTQPHTDHRRTTRSEPPFYVPVTASSDARGRPFRTGSNTPCHTSGTRHSSISSGPCPGVDAQHAATDKEPDATRFFKRVSSIGVTEREKMTICPRGLLNKGISVKKRFRQPVADHSPAGRS